jgi:hypothetical protein
MDFKMLCFQFELKACFRYLKTAFQIIPRCLWSWRRGSVHSLHVDYRRDPLSLWLSYIATQLTFTKPAWCSCASPAPSPVGSVHPLSTVNIVIILSLTAAKKSWISTGRALETDTLCNEHFFARPSSSWAFWCFVTLGHGLIWSYQLLACGIIDFQSFPFTISTLSMSRPFFDVSISRSIHDRNWIVGWASKCDSLVLSQIKKRMK